MPVAEPIAIVGIGCRFPGADGPEAFWRLIVGGVDAVTEVPAGRFDVDAVYDPTPGARGKIVTRQGGFLGAVDTFDASFFGISPREAASMDPQQRLLLEVTVEAFEDAGVPRERLAESETGVFVGMWTSEYEGRMFAASPDLDVVVTNGTGRYAASGRISFVFDLRGPSLTVDTGCSSSLVAVHLACQSLRSGESEMAVAGGVNLILDSQISVAYSRSAILSPDGRCRFGDARASGYVRSEGVGVVVLKPLSRALADNDAIHAIIRGSAVNNDGQASGLLVAPSPVAQAAMLRQAYRTAGVAPGRVGYVEAHGTGTRVGDPVELTALGEVLGEGRPPSRPCRVGSVKTNIGHTEAAAGIAGLIKAVLCLKHRTIPPSLHFSEPNPDVAWGRLPLIVARALEAWPDDTVPAVAGVNSFGITGTNAHVVLEEAPVRPTAPAVPHSGTARLLALSASTLEALDALSERWTALLERGQDAGALEDLCYTAAVRRTAHAQRLGVVGATPAELVDRLRAHRRGEAGARLASGRAGGGRPRVVFVFPGQGSQWLGMGRLLLANEPVFAEALRRCEKALAPHVSWSLTHELMADADRSQLERIDVVQPTLFAIQVALAALWRAWGVAPDAVVGHSMGEVAAAHVAGALSLEDAARVIATRSRLLRGIAGRGAMAMVELSLTEARQTLTGREDRLSIAVSNSARSTVISGDVTALDDLLAELERRGVFGRRVKVDVASHSPQVDGLRADLMAALAGITSGATTCPLYSTVTGAIQDGPGLGPDYWARNLREPVLFATTVGRLRADGIDAFVEISPHPVLVSAVQDTGRSAGLDPRLVLPSTRREEDERAVLLESLATLWTRGHPIEWSRLFAEDCRVVPAPTYPWQRERFWQESAARPIAAAAPGAQWLGLQLASTPAEQRHVWQTELSTTALPRLADHRVDGVVVAPAALYVDLALGAAAAVLGPGPHALHHLTLTEPLVLLPSQSRTVRLVLDPRDDGGEIRLSSTASPADPAGAVWMLHASASVRPAGGMAPVGVPAALPADEDAGAAAQHYEALRGIGLDYGTGFRGVQAVWRTDDGTIARLRTPAVPREPDALVWHPALLDAALQVALTTAVDVSVDPRLHVPTSIVRLESHRQPAPDEEIWCRAVRRSGPGARPAADLTLFGPGREVLLEATGIEFTPLDAAALHARREASLPPMFELQWREEPRQAPRDPASPRTPSSWLILADADEVGASLAALLTARGDRCVLVSPAADYAQTGPDSYVVAPGRPDDLRRLLREGFGTSQPPCRGVVHLWSLRVPDPDGLTALTLDAQDLGVISALHLVQALGMGEGERPRLWLVTRGVHAVGETTGVAVGQSPLWGLATVVAAEHRDLGCSIVDLGHCRAQEIAALGEEIDDGVAGELVCLRATRRYVARLAPALANTPSLPSPAAMMPLAAGAAPYRVDVLSPGRLDSLVARVVERRPPAGDEVEIEVCAVGLNFMNVMSAMGICPGYPDGVGPLGIECAGRVVAVGDGVTSFRPGDGVMGLVYDSLATHAIARAELVVAIPAGMSFEEAATIPIAYVTAWYALTRLARLEAGERVLVHAAAGGVGLAAVRLARWIGAEVWATAGNADKHAFLRDAGVEHLFDSRSLDFGPAIIAGTGGAGVDVVLNSLSGEAVTTGLSVLGTGGRFVEIAKRDIYDGGRMALAPFRKSLAYFAVDVDRLARERPRLVGALLREVADLVARGALTPLPRTTFPIGAASDAFGHMAQARHIGKIVLRVEGEEVRAVGPARAITAEHTYLITGGLGGLGLRTAEWLADQGARHIALLGRRAPSTAAAVTLRRLSERGVAVHCLQADVADTGELDGALAEVKRAMPPLRGVFHAAGVLDDGLLSNLDRDRFRAALAPKVLGAWNLHILTAGLALDSFVLFSSVSPLLGLPGQGNYAAANAFLDALAGLRRTLGLPALSIAYGPWRDVGLAADRADRGERLAHQGLGNLTPEEGLSALHHLMGSGRVHAAVMPVDVPRWLEAHPHAASSGLLADLVDASAPVGSGPAERGVRGALLAAAPGRARREILETLLGDSVARVLRLSRVAVDVRKPLREVGLDSLTALELRNGLEMDLGLTLPATFVWNYPTIRALVPYLAERMGIPLHGPARDDAETTAPDPGPEDTDVEGALVAELARADALLRRPPR